MDDPSVPRMPPPNRLVFVSGIVVVVVFLVISSRLQFAIDHVLLKAFGSGSWPSRGLHPLRDSRGARRSDDPCDEEFLPRGSD
jgi:hypothetical protein